MLVPGDTSLGSLCMAWEHPFSIEEAFNAQTQVNENIQQPESQDLQGSGSGRFYGRHGEKCRDDRVTASLRDHILTLHNRYAIMTL